MEQITLFNKPEPGFIRRFSADLYAIFTGHRKLSFGHLLSCTCLIFFSFSEVTGQEKDWFSVDPDLETAYSEIQKLRLEKARLILENEKSGNKENGFVAYLESYSDFFYFLISDSQSEYSAFSKKQDQRLQRISRLSAASPYQRMLMAEIRLHTAFVKLKFGNRTGGCWDIVKANKLLEENLRLFPDFVPQLKSLGLLHVMIGSVPEEYQWITRMIGLKGNIRQGLSELRQVVQESELFRKEAEITSLLLHAYVLHPDDRLIARLRELPYREPDNLLFHFLSASILMKKGEGENALTILNKAPQSKDYLNFPFLGYMKAEVYLQKGAYEKAANEYRYFLGKTKGNNFIKDSYFKLYLCKWLSGEKTDGDLLRKITGSGSVNVEADKHAQKVAERFLSGKIATEQKALFEARYAFDGGFLPRALKAFNGLDENSFKLLSSKIEYNYRLGRILQYQDKPVESIPYLKRTVTMSQGNELYFGASAALQLGYIYREMGQTETAINYFRKAISFKKHEYKNSIDNKARAALTELGAP